MREGFTTALELVGLLMVAAGCGWYSLGLGLIVLGLGLIALGYLASAKPAKARA